MAKNAITQEGFGAWSASNFYEYASESVPSSGRSGVIQRLVLSASLAGEFKVELGAKLLYRGRSFDDARLAYEAN